MPTSITCYGGIAEIGGNKVLIEDEERRLILDFGKSFSRYGAYFDGIFIRERAARGLLDRLMLGLIPPLRGLLREDLVPALDPDEIKVSDVPPQGKQRKSRDLVEIKSPAREAF
ncbi:MAG: hypothetical protein ACE5M4_09635 [Anaerolineales bacterium]